MLGKSNLGGKGKVGCGWATHELEHNKDQPAGDLYPNLQVIKFLEADHDPQVLNPF